MNSRGMRGFLGGAGSAIGAFFLFLAMFCAVAEMRPLKEPPARDPNVVNGTADVRFSREWWKVRHEQFNQAVAEKNTDLVVSLAFDSADGWRYNAPVTYTILLDAVKYLKYKSPDRQDDLIMLMTAQAEAVQYVMPGNEMARDFIAGEVLCAPYERAMIYKESGRYEPALRELQQFYEDGRAERERLRGKPDIFTCPCEEEAVLAELVRMHLALALADDATADAVRRHYQGAFDCNMALMDHATATNLFKWGDEKISAHFGLSVWNVGNLSFFLARQMRFSPQEYIQAAAETLKRLTGPEPFSLDEALLGQEYLTAKGASESQLWKFLGLYQEYFGGWPEGANGIEYQSCTLRRLDCAIRHGNRANAESVIAELSGVPLADPELLKTFNALRAALQKDLRAQ